MKNLKSISIFLITALAIMGIIAVSGNMTVFANGSIVQQKFGSASSVTTLTTTFTSSTTIGNEIIVLVGTFYGATVAVTDSQSNSYTSQLSASITCSSVEHDLHIYSTLATANTADAITITLSGGASSPNFPSMSIYELTGVSLSSGVVTSTGQSGNSGGSGCPSQNAHVNSFSAGTSGIVLAEVMTGLQESGTAGAGYTMITATSQYGTGQYSGSIVGATTAPITLSDALASWLEGAITFDNGGNTTTTFVTTLSTQTTTYLSSTTTTTTQMSLTTTTTTTSTTTSVSGQADLNTYSNAWIDFLIFIVLIASALTVMAFMRKDLLGSE